jgi:hypothetical protein
MIELHIHGRGGQVEQIEIAADGSQCIFGYSYCKGCRLCAHEDPTGYRVMLEGICNAAWVWSARRGV